MLMHNFISWFSSLFFYVIADPHDNSITFNRWLFRDMGGKHLDSAKVFVFRITDTGEYGMILNPSIGRETQLADIQYNTKYRCIGIESLNPTVNRILYDYWMPVVRSRLAVARRRLPDGTKYYAILNPMRKKWIVF